MAKIENLNVNVEISINDIVSELDVVQAKKLILETDDYRCDMDFSKSVIESLLDSVAQCLTFDEWNEWLSDLQQKEHNHQKEDWD